MNTIVEIQNAVKALPAAQFEMFSSWFDEYEEKLWDKQIQSDQQSGPLNDMMNRGRADFEAGKCTKL